MPCFARRAVALQPHAATTAALLCLAGMVGTASAATIAGTSFETVTTDTGLEAILAPFEAGDVVDHWTAKMGELPTIPTFGGSATELGFTTTVASTPNGSTSQTAPSTGSDDFDRLGVIDDNPSGPGDYAFIVSDADSQLDITFDDVDLTGNKGVTFSIDYYIEGTYEAGDLFRVVLQLAGEPDITLIDFAEAELDHASMSGNYITEDFPIPDTADSATLVVSVANNAASENIYFDNIVFETSAVPEPLTLTGGVVGLACLTLQRRSKAY